VLAKTNNSVLWIRNASLLQIIKKQHFAQHHFVTFLNYYLSVFKKSVSFSLDTC